MTNANDQISLTGMEADIIGEVMNISMGAAATAMSTILDKKVSITTPRLVTSKVKEYEFSHLEPVVGVLIKYIEGIGGFNLLLLKVEDLKKILAHLLSMEAKDINEFDEIGKSAICEIMNQMMGSASSALASFLGVKVNISPPDIIDAMDKKGVQERFSVSGENILSIGFDINIEGMVKSEFVSIMEPRLAKEIIKMSLGENQVEQDEEEKTETIIDLEPIAKKEAVVDVPEPQISDAGPPVPKEKVQAVPYSYPDLGSEKPAGSGLNSNLDLIMSVPVQITVELGKTKRKIKDITEFAPGNIIVLDRQAGDQVDIVANGRLIARGDVVVVDDNYSVRITEIMKARGSIADLK
jgi:flagellar motor switch protein FliN/FliY